MTVDPKALRQARLNFGLTREQAAEGGFLSGLGRRRGQNPSTGCAGPPPFGKGGWRRTGLRAMNKGAFAVPAGAGEGRGRVLGEPPLRKGGGAGRRPAEGGFLLAHRPWALLGRKFHWFIE